MAFNNPVVGGENGELIRRSIQSPDYVAGTTGWSINRDGSAEFNNVTIRLDLAAGSIIVGPSGMPQVVIGSDAFKGFIEFPTNDPSEVNTAIVQGAITNSGLPFQNLDLELRSPSVNASQYSFIRLSSQNSDLSDAQRITLGLNGLSNSLEVSEDNIRANGEIFVNGTGLDDNYVMRLTDGRTNGVSAVTALGVGVDTLITNNACQSCPLENGVAYRVDVQIRTQSTAAGAVAGTNLVVWKLWDGAVGGTQLGPSIQKVVESAGTTSSSQNFTFVFHHTGSTGSRTLNLSGNHFAGPNPITASTSNQYYMLVTRIGDPNRVQNL